jgi:uncharacterized protein with von Willebrand factor type A (vWA) domain
VERDWKPDRLKINGEDFHFVFIIDRSGSMTGEYINCAKKALKLFIKSLPLGCRFTFVSFGNVSQLHKALKPDIIKDRMLALTPPDDSDIPGAF